MTKSAIADWDTTAANNTDIGGIDIDENCDAANINDAIRELMAQVASYAAVVTLGGAADAYTATPTKAWGSSYQAGDTVVGLVDTGDTNTGASTLNVSGLGAADIKTLDGDDPVPGDILAGLIHTFVHDGTNFVLMNPAPPVVRLASGTFSAAVASLDFTVGDWTAFKEIVVRLYDLIPATDAVTLYLRTSSNGGSTFDIAEYNWANHRVDNVSTHDVLRPGTHANIELCRELGINTNERRYVEIRLQNPGSSPPSGTAASYLRWTVHGRTAAEVEERVDGQGGRIVVEDIDALQIRASSGNLASGVYEMWGYR